MAKQSKSGGVRSEIARAIWIAAFASALGIVINVYSHKPLAIFAETAAAPADTPVVKGKITIEEFIRALKGNASIILLDVRGNVEYEAEHSPSALHVPLSELMSRHAQIAPNLQGAETIVTMCDSEECGMAEEAAELLLKLGYKNVRVLKGGWESYRQTNLPREGGKL